MTVQELRDKIDEAARRFLTTESALPRVVPTRPTISQKVQDLLRSAAEWMAVTAPKVSLREARDGLKAAHDVLLKLARATSDTQELEAYLAAMVALTEELTKVVEKELENTAAAYAPLTAAFRSASATLKGAKAKAEQLASQLGLAADVLGAFAKLVGAL